MSKQSRLVKNTMILLVGIIGTKLINFIMLPFLTSWFTVEEYGMIDIFVTIVSLIVPFCTLQLEQAVFRFLIDDKTLDDRKATVTSSVICLVSILITIDIIAGIYLLQNSKHLYFLYLIAINLQAIYVMAQQIVRGKGENNIYTINSIIFAFSTMGLTVLFVRLFNLGVAGYVLGYNCANFFAIVFMAARSGLWKLLEISQFSIKKLKELLSYSGPMIVNNISWWILNASDKLILNIFIGASANGIFASAGKIPGLITSVYSVFQMAWQESASREQNETNLIKFYSEVFRSLLVLMSYGVVVILLTSNILFPLLIDKKFESAYYHIPILLLGLFFLCIAQFYGGIYVGLHNTRALGKTSAIAAIINLVVDLATVQYLGIYAASISTLIAYAFLLIIRIRDMKKVADIQYNKKDILITSVSLAGAVLITYFGNIFTQYVFLALVTVIYIYFFRDIVNKIILMIWKKHK